MVRTSPLCLFRTSIDDGLEGLGDVLGGDLEDRLDDRLGLVAAEEMPVSVAAKIRKGKIDSSPEKAM